MPGQGRLNVEGSSAWIQEAHGKVNVRGDTEEPDICVEAKEPDLGVSEKKEL